MQSTIFESMGLGCLPLSHQPDLKHAMLWFFEVHWPSTSLINERLISVRLLQLWNEIHVEHERRTDRGSWFFPRPRSCKIWNIKRFYSEAEVMTMAITACFCCTWSRSLSPCGVIKLAVAGTTSANAAYHTAHRSTCTNAEGVPSVWVHSFFKVFWPSIVWTSRTGASC